MKLIKPSFKVLHPSHSYYAPMLQRIEVAGRTCYKSENRITSSSSEGFIKMLIHRGHESVLEHEKITVKFICDRGISHELVRHRIASFSQESTRYCNYSTDKFKNELTFIIPPWINIGESKKGFPINIPCLSYKKGTMEWLKSLYEAEKTYLHLTIKDKWKPEEARSILPNSLKTEVVVTANLREWRLILKQRTSKAAHPQMRELMFPLLVLLKKKMPAVFEDIYNDIQC